MVVTLMLAAAVLMVTDWRTSNKQPFTLHKPGLCLSGIESVYEHLVLRLGVAHCALKAMNTLVYNILTSLVMYSKSSDRIPTNTMICTRKTSCAKPYSVTLHIISIFHIYFEFILNYFGHSPNFGLWLVVIGAPPASSFHGPEQYLTACNFREIL